MVLSAWSHCKSLPGSFDEWKTNSTVCWRYCGVSTASLVAGMTPDTIPYKLAVITYKTRSIGSPTYLSSLLNTYIPPQTLQSSVKNLLTIPRMTLTQSAKAFCVSAPSVWNRLSDHCQQAELLSTFKTDWKLNCFTQPTTASVYTHYCQRSHHSDQTWHLLYHSTVGWVNLTKHMLKRLHVLD